MFSCSKICNTTSRGCFTLLVLHEASFQNLSSLRVFGAPLQTLSQQWYIVWGPFANPFTAMVYCLGPLCKPFHGNCVESHCYNILPKFYCKRQLEMDILKQLYWYFNTEHNIGPHQLRQIWKNLVICFLHC